MKIVRFATVGGTVMLVFMGLNKLFADLWGKQVGFLVAYPPAVGLHFCLNKWWTFGCKRSDSVRQFSEYAIMVAVTFVIQWAVFSALVTWTTMPSWLAAGIANAVQMIVTFVVMSRRIFASPAPVS